MKFFESGNRLIWLLIAAEAVVCLVLAFIFFGKGDKAPVEPVVEPPKTLALVDDSKKQADDDEKGDSFTIYSEPATQVRQPEPVVRPDNRALPSRLIKPKIIIHKKRGILEVYSDGKLVKTYLASTGTHSGDKIRSGDRRTPEGEFYVCVRNPKSQYVLSLGLSYPSFSDAKRGLKDGLITQAQYNHIVSELRLKRQPPWNTKLGGSIMIHGQRQGGRATAGCIALEDDDIRELYPRIPLRTKVIIKP